MVDETEFNIMDAEEDIDSEETVEKMQEEVRLKDAIGMAEHELAEASEALRQANINLYDLQQELEDLGL